MNRSEQLCLLVTAGDGPAECHQAVDKILQRMEHEASLYDLALSTHRVDTKYGAKSGVVVADGALRHSFARAWLGTIQWKTQSALRRHHRRSNWFVGVFALTPGTPAGGLIDPKDVAFSTLRAGGPGGQHQNTTDSAVRAVHGPSGLTVVARDARSQHRNKALALDRLQALADAQDAADQAQQKSRQNRLHHSLERGNPVRMFTGAGFEEVLKKR